jgi:hypothetical protein
MLDSPSGWLPKLAGAGGIDQWLRVDLGASTNVVGVVTQGRFGNSRLGQHAKKYEVLTSVDGSTFVTRGSFDAKLPGANSRNKNMFSSNVECRYVKFVVKEAGGGWAALRAGFIVQRAAPTPIASVECRYVKIVVKRAGIDYAALRAAVLVQRPPPQQAAKKPRSVFPQGCFVSEAYSTQYSLSLKSCPGLPIGSRYHPVAPSFDEKKANTRAVSRLFIQDEPR